jgi:hypothetical protein
MNSYIILFFDIYKLLVDLIKFTSYKVIVWFLCWQITDLPPGRVPVETYIFEGNYDGFEDVYKVWYCFILTCLNVLCSLKHVSRIL